MRFDMFKRNLGVFHYNIIIELRTQLINTGLILNLIIRLNGLDGNFSINNHV
jgi:hypothetical protein